MKKKLWPSCGMQKCKHPAKYSDASGVGFCEIHRTPRYKLNNGRWYYVNAQGQIRSFDPWWTAITIAEDIGGDIGKAWENAKYGEYPTGGPWDPTAGEEIEG
jgi:hypothetical protein